MSYAKSKGTKFESDFVKYLIEHGFSDARREVLHGKNDVGDVHIGEVNNPKFVFECKSYAKELPYKMVEDFVDEAKTEFGNAVKDRYYLDCPNHAVLVVKRPNLGVADSWLIWKTMSGITMRCRLGDVINKEFFPETITLKDRFDILDRLLLV